MKLTIGHVIKGLAGVAICSVILLSQTDSAQAVLEGSNRDRMEYLHFSEKIIHRGLYAKDGKATFNKSKKRYVRGIRRHNEPKIYQPDVYTWELSMAEHRKKLQDMVPPEEAPIPNVSPVPMEQDGIIPSNPEPTYLAPACEGACSGKSFDPNQVANIPALQPAAYPNGTRGDSCDASF